MSPFKSFGLFVAAGIVTIAVAAPAQYYAHHNPPSAFRAAIQSAVDAPSRTPEAKQRDRYRHPAETLQFFDVKPHHHVVEYAPGGGGWYTEILAPLLKDKGKLYAAQPGKTETLKAKLDANPGVYGKVSLVPWSQVSTDIRAGSVDAVLTFRNVHNMVMNETAPQTFATFFTLLKPGGTLGIVDHRLPEARDTALEKQSGYLKTSTVRRLAEQAGFELVAASEVNANPKDSADWPNGVWTLPPTLRLGDADRAKYLAIGESDRMTLRFRKPVKAKS